MTSTSLHPTPSSQTVAIEQFRAVGLALRKEAIFFIGALVVIGVLIVANAVHFMQTHPYANVHTAYSMGFTYGVAGAIPICFLAVIIPFGVWRAEDPSRRAYHWSMPVARGPHTIAKFLSGWAWVMIASAVYLLFIILLATVLSTISGEANTLGNTPAWEWIVAFTSTTLAYFLISIPVIASDHAWQWIVGLYVGYWVLIGFLTSFGLPEASRLLRTIGGGTYGLDAATFGGGTYVHGLSMSNWLIAMPLWIIGSAIAVTVASYRHRE
ncbi:MAG TPA: hypothetical protein VII66_00385 [Gemmatimonadaceae bacterium]